MLGSIRLLFLRAKLLGVMVNKFSAGMFTGSGSSLIFSGCSPSTSQLLDTTSVPWLACHVAENGFSALCFMLSVFCALSVFPLLGSFKLFVFHAITP